MPDPGPDAPAEPPSKPDADLLVVPRSLRKGTKLKLAVTGTFNGAKLNYRVRAGVETAPTEVVAPTTFVTPQDVSILDAAMQGGDDVIVQADFTVVQPAGAIATELFIAVELCVAGQVARAWDTVKLQSGQAGKLSSLSFLVVVA